MKVTGYVISRKALPSFNRAALKLLFRYGGLYTFEDLETIIQPSSHTLVTFDSLAEAVQFIITGGFADIAEVRICEETHDKDGLPNGICFARVSYKGGK